LQVPRERNLNRGLYEGAENDAYVLLVLFVFGLAVLPQGFGFRPWFLVLAAVVFGIGVFGVKRLQKWEPRFFKKWFSYRRWSGAFRARPPMIAVRARQARQKKKQKGV